MSNGQSVVLGVIILIFLSAVGLLAYYSFRKRRKFQKIKERMDEILSRYSPTNPEKWEIRNAWPGGRRPPREWDNVDQQEWDRLAKSKFEEKFEALLGCLGIVVLALMLTSLVLDITSDREWFHETTERRVSFVDREIHESMFFKEDEVIVYFENGDSKKLDFDELQIQYSNVEYPYLSITTRWSVRSYMFFERTWRQRTKYVLHLSPDETFQLHS